MEIPQSFGSGGRSKKCYPRSPTDDAFLYEYQEGEPTELIEATHGFHKFFNTDCPTASLVYGNGSTQVINAILYALTKRLDRPLVVAYAPPYYMLMHEFLFHCKFVSRTSDFTRTDIDVEIVTDPNNPSGEHRVHKSTAPYVIFDRAYNWPIYMNEMRLTPTSAAPNHMTVYTISKCLGMGGLRLGRAFINDKILTADINRALFVIGICPNSFGMRAVTQIFQTFLKNPTYFNNNVLSIRHIIKARRSQLIEYAFMNDALFQVVNSTGPYAWIQSRDGSDIAATLLACAHVQVYSGTQFGATFDYARLSLICSTEDFATALKRLRRL